MLFTGQIFRHKKADGAFKVFVLKTYVSINQHQGTESKSRVAERVVGLGEHYNHKLSVGGEQEKGIMIPSSLEHPHCMFNMLKPLRSSGVRTLLFSLTFPNFT